MGWNMAAGGGAGAVPPTCRWDRAGLLVVLLEQVHPPADGIEHGCWWCCWSRSTHLQMGSSRAAGGAAGAGPPTYRWDRAWLLVVLQEQVHPPADGIEQGCWWCCRSRSTHQQMGSSRAAGGAAGASPPTCRWDGTWLLVVVQEQFHPPADGMEQGCWWCCRSRSTHLQMGWNMAAGGGAGAGEADRPTDGSRTKRNRPIHVPVRQSETRATGIDGFARFEPHTKGMRRTRSDSIKNERKDFLSNRTKLARKARVFPHLRVRARRDASSFIANTNERKRDHVGSRGNG
eukprot:scaffold769_cov278-Pavlova_lutheri.AAC.6